MSLQELMRWGGYLVEGVDGLILATFSSAASAACWGLACQRQMMLQVRMSHTWSQEAIRKHLHQVLWYACKDAGNRSPLQFHTLQCAQSRWCDGMSSAADHADACALSMLENSIGPDFLL